MGLSDKLDKVRATIFGSHDEVMSIFDLWISQKKQPIPLLMQIPVWDLKPKCTANDASMYVRTVIWVVIPSPRCWVSVLPR